MGPAGLAPAIFTILNFYTRQGDVIATRPWAPLGSHILQVSYYYCN